MDGGRGHLQAIISTYDVCLFTRGINPRSSLSVSLRV